MKPWWQSKTIRLNILIGLLAMVPTMDPALMPPKAWPWILLACNALNVVLRTISAAQLTMTNQQD